MAQDQTYQTPFTLEALQALESAIVQGVQTVKYTDKEVTYRSLTDMMRVRDLIRSQLGLNSGFGDGVFGGRKVNPVHDKALTSKNCKKE